MASYQLASLRSVLRADFEPKKNAKSATALSVLLKTIVPASHKLGSILRPNIRRGADG